jgi:hypothetical protein
MHTTTCIFPTRRFWRLLAIIGIAWFEIAFGAIAADAQVFGGRPGGRLGARLAERLGQTPAAEPAAVAGTPFGVGRITVQFPPQAVGPIGSGAILNEPPLALTEANGRVFYPASVDTPIRAAIRELLARPRPATVYFLFTGDEPLDVTLYGPGGVSQRIAVQRDPQMHQQILNEWWKQYEGSIGRPNRSTDYPHLVDAYLTAMLSNRLSLPPIEWPTGFFAEKLPEMNQTVGLVLGTESDRLAIERDTMLHPITDASAPLQLQPLPPAAPLAALPMPEEIGPVQIEPLASHVPEECLYIRFAGFPNYQWFRSTLDDWGGDLRNMISRRGVDYGLNPKLERQLSLKENALSQLLGPTVIADVAVIGDDPFFREGAAIGMLFQARVNALLANDIRRNRNETMAAIPDTKETHVTIAAHDVSFLSTPDNRVRSFYAVDGDFQLVTTSRRIVERFYEAGSGKRSLSQATDFRNARGRRKPSDADAVFAYLSEAFFRNLASPQYQIEMTRRLRSATDIELVAMAELAARNEHKPADSIEQLVAGGFLPQGFASPARRPDGSRLVLHADGLATDSLRGAGGTFLPIPDVDIIQATAGELSAYSRFSETLASGGAGPIGPTLVAVQRTRLGEPGLENVTLDVRMLPLINNGDKFVRPALGPAGRQRVSPYPGNVVSLEISASGNGLLKSLFPSNGNTPSTHLFFGVLNSEPPAQGMPAAAGLPLQGLIGQVVPVVSTIESLRWYIGGWPSPGGLERLGIGGPNVQTDAEGFGFGGGFWQRQISAPVGPITVASMKRDVVAEVAGNLDIVDAPQPAQIWLQAGDINGSRIAGLFNQIGYLRARSVSRGNQNFLDRLTTQLGVPPDQALRVAENLLNARVVSPIGGRYEMQNRGGEFPTWSLAGATEGRGGILAGGPPGFVTPPLNWLRGANVYGGTDTSGLWAHAELVMQRPDENATGGAGAPAGQRAQPQAGPPIQSVLPAPTSVPPAPVPPPPAPGR